MKRTYILVLLAGICISSQAQSFNEIQRSIVATSPNLSSSEAATKSELLQRKSANNLPDPELNGEYQWGQSNVGDKWSVGVSQSFEWPGVYQARNQANKQATVAADARISSNYADKMLDVKLLLIQYVAVKQRIQILDEIKKHVTDLNTFYKNAYDHGETTIIDLNKSAIELADIKNRYNVELNELDLAIEAIQKEAGLTSVSSLLSSLDQYPAEAMLSEDEYTRLINTADQSIRYADASLKTAIFDAKAIKRSATAPGFNLGYTHLYEQGERFNGLSLGLSLPVFSARGKYKAATYQVQSISTALDAIKADRISEMKSCRAQALRMSDQLSELAPVVLDKRPAELLHKALKGGEISLLTYLQELNFFLEAQLNYTDMLRDYHLVMARLNRYADSAM